MNLMKILLNSQFNILQIGDINIMKSKFARYIEDSFNIFLNYLDNNFKLT